MKYKLLPLLGALLLITNADAALSYSFNLIGSGTVSPSGLAPWLTASIDEVDADTVTLTITSNLNSTTEFFSGIGFSLTETFNYGSLDIAGYSQTGSFDAPSVVVGPNSSQGYGNIPYDVFFTFDTTGTDGGSHRFNGTDSFIYTINGIGIDDVDITNNAGVAHVQGIQFFNQETQLNEQTSAWILPTTVNTSQVPEPSSMLLGGLGILAILRRRR